MFGNIAAECVKFMLEASQCIDGKEINIGHILTHTPRHNNSNTTTDTEKRCVGACVCVNA